MNDYDDDPTLWDKTVNGLEDVLLYFGLKTIISIILWLVLIVTLIVRCNT